MTTEKKTAAVIMFNFAEMDEEAVNHVYEAQSHLLKAGITFDTGSGFGKHDWMLDWSLSGPMEIMILKDR